MLSGVADASFDAAPSPISFTAFTVKTYVVPLVSPDTSKDVSVIGSASSGVTESPSYTLYPVIGLPPSDAGGVHSRCADPSPGVAVRSMGASGTVAAPVSGVADASLDASPSPIAFTAFTVKTYVVPLSRPVTSKDVSVTGSALSGVTESPSYTL